MDADQTAVAANGVETESASGTNRAPLAEVTLPGRPIDHALAQSSPSRFFHLLAEQDLRREDHPRLSVVVPAYKDGPRIVENLQWLEAALDATAMTWEMIVVIDGDRETYLHASRLASERITVLGYDRNRGKGFALRYGLAQASGDLITFIDSDMEIGPEEIGRMAKLLELYNADVVVGSKRHPLSVVHYPVARRIQSLCYQVLVRLLFRVKVRDTQTGLKMMRRQVAIRVLRVAVVKRFAFDLELLALAVHFGFSRIIEAPVTVRYTFRSTTSPRAVVVVLRDTAAIFYRLRLRQWYDKAGAEGIDALCGALPSP